MLLRDLQPGQRFEFADKSTKLVLCNRNLFNPEGSFVYNGVGEGTSVKLLSHGQHEILAIPGTFNREVLRIF